MFSEMFLEMFSEKFSEMFSEKFLKKLSTFRKVFYIQKSFLHSEKLVERTFNKENISISFAPGGPGQVEYRFDFDRIW